MKTSQTNLVRVAAMAAGLISTPVLPLGMASTLSKLARSMDEQIKTARQASKAFSDDAHRMAARIETGSVRGLDLPCPRRLADLHALIETIRIQQETFEEFFDETFAAYGIDLYDVITILRVHFEDDGWSVVNDWYQHAAGLVRLGAAMRKENRDLARETAFRLLAVPATKPRRAKR